MSYGYMGAANEAMFDAEQTAENLLDAIRTNVNANVNSIDAAASLENKLSEQAASFNVCLSEIANTMRKCEAGEISREQAVDECSPYVQALKNDCEALNLSGVNVGSGDITEEEIAMLREVIVGAKDIVAARKRDLEDSPIFDASEGVMSTLYNMTPANENAVSRAILGSPEKKSADELYKSAKKLYSLGQERKAVEYMTKAKKLYEKVLTAIKKNTKWINVERTVGGASVDKFKTTSATNLGTHMSAGYIADRIDSCTAWLIKWSNRAGNVEYQALKERLKKERKYARKSGANENYSYGGGTMLDPVVEEYFEALSEFDDACESFMDGLEAELSLSAALEADGSESSISNPKSPSGIGARLRAAFSKLKKSKAVNDTNGARAAAAEVKSAAKDLEEASRGADEETKKRLSTAAKIGLAAAGAAAAVAGLTVAGAQLKKSAEAKNVELNQAQRLLVNTSDKVLQAKSFVGDHAAMLGDSIHDKQRMAGLRVKQGFAQAKRNVSRAYQDARTKTLTAGAEMRDKFDPQERGLAVIDDDFEKRVRMAYARPGEYHQSFAKAKESWSISDLLSTMAMESDLDSIMYEEVRMQPQTGRGFDPYDMQGNNIIEDAEEGCDDADDLATESFIAEMAMLDGFYDD